MVVAENVSFQIQLELLDSLPSIVDNVHVDKDGGSADPALAMKSSRDSDNLEGRASWFGVLVRRSQGAGQRH